MISLTSTYLWLIYYYELYVCKVEKSKRLFKINQLEFFFHIAFRWNIFMLKKKLGKKNKSQILLKSSYFLSASSYSFAKPKKKSIIPQDIRLFAQFRTRNNFMLSMLKFQQCIFRWMSEFFSRCIHCNEHKWKKKLPWRVNENPLLIPFSLERSIRQSCARAP